MLCESRTTTHQDLAKSSLLRLLLLMAHLLPKQHHLRMKDGRMTEHARTRHRIGLRRTAGADAVRDRIRATKAMAVSMINKITMMTKVLVDARLMRSTGYNQSHTSPSLKVRPLCLMSLTIPTADQHGDRVADRSRSTYASCRSAAWGAPTSTRSPSSAAGTSCSATATARTTSASSSPS